MAQDAPHFRVHRRQALRLRAVVTHAREGWQREAQVVNLGLGGACVKLEGPLVSGDRVSISFLAPSLWDPLALPARVAWAAGPSHRDPSLAGLSFEPPDAAAVYALFELVATLAF